MLLTNLKTNHLENPLGFSLEPLTLSWTAESQDQKPVSSRVEIALDPDFTQIVYDSGEGNLNALAFHPELTLRPWTRYWWRVSVTGDGGDRGTSEPAWFQTAKLEEPWQAQWITSSFDKDRQFILRRKFEAGEVRRAFACLCGLGSYELYLNGEKAGDELLAPGFHSYDFWLQYQTVDLTGLLRSGENTLTVLLAPAWYKGHFGFDGGFYDNYGERMQLICEVRLEMADGSVQWIRSDGSWEAAPSFVTHSDIYYGEDQDARLAADPQWSPAVVCEGRTDLLKARLSPIVRVTQQLKPVELIHTPAGETVLDFGQNMTGWVEFDCHLPAGQRVQLHYGELLQEGNFYRDNLRSAEAQFSYISDGNPAHVRPHGTFYGFRYLRVEGMEVDPAAFTACVIHSDLPRTGWIETSDPRLNRLFENAMWSQRDNFLDVPTDCPQRDERMGWTGDAQIFAGTACFNLYSPAFYNKYMADLMLEQKPLEGGVPFVVPVIKKSDEKRNMLANHSSCAWGDVACVLPWQLYQYYGDLEMLRRHYPAMQGWVAYIRRQDEENGGHRLWQTGFHFADWLALDNYRDPESSFGGTDCYYVASAYYAWSATLAARAAKALGLEEDAREYEQLAAEVRAAITREYFTPAGRCAIDTQTALVLALYMELTPASYRPRLIEDLRRKLKENGMHLNTGFVGTPYLCPTLSAAGAAEDAYTLLLQEDYPSWLYEVKMGATTIWERWNSVLPDGKISGTGMNSMNHYAYGSIVEWMYRYMCGLQPQAPGCTTMVIAPQPDRRLGWAKAVYDSAAGRYESGWRLEGDTFRYELKIPFGCEARVLLPGREPMTLGAGQYQF